MEKRIEGRKRRFWFDINIITEKWEIVDTISFTPTSSGPIAISIPFTHLFIYLFCFLFFVFCFLFFVFLFFVFCFLFFVFCFLFLFCAKKNRLIMTNADVPANMIGQTVAYVRLLHKSGIKLICILTILLL